MKLKVKMLKVKVVFVWLFLQSNWFLLENKTRST